MESFFFYLFAAVAVLGGLLVVVNPFSRNPVTNAMWLVVSMIALSGIFVLLHAYFLAATQILVYAGAVMVLFLFVIMLLDLKEEEHQKWGFVRLGFGIMAASMVAAVLIHTMLHSGTNAAETAAILDGGAKPLGALLFTDYMLPFEIMSVLLLVGMIGVVVLSKKELK